jgi:hypothetical protein
MLAAYAVVIGRYPVIGENLQEWDLRQPDAAKTGGA